MLSLVNIFPITATAQSPLPTVPVDSGREVRAEFPKEQVRGRLLLRYTPGDSIMRVCTFPAWRCGGGDASVIRELRTQAMVRLEVQRGTHAKQGAIIGGVIGGILGGLYGTLVAGLCESSDCPPALFMGTARGAVTGGAVVGLLGYGIGSSVTRWGPAP